MGVPLPPPPPRAMSAKQERIKRVYPLVRGNDNRFSRVFSLFEHVSKSAWSSRKRKRSQVTVWNKALTNTTHKLVSVKRDRLECASKQQRFPFFIFLARLCSVWSILIFWLSKSQFGRSNESPWSQDILALRGNEALSKCFVVSGVVYTGFNNLIDQMQLLSTNFLWLS